MDVGLTETTIETLGAARLPLLALGDCPAEPLVRLFEGQGGGESVGARHVVVDRTAAVPHDLANVCT